MIILNDVRKGKVTLNPEYITLKKPCFENSYAREKGAETFVNYVEPGQPAVHYYATESMEEINKLIAEAGAK